MGGKRRKFFQIIAIAMISILTTTGCGTAMYDLTDEERGLIVDYAAYVVGKHNVYQKDGMIAGVKSSKDKPSASDSDSQTSTGQEDGRDSSGKSEKGISLGKALGYDALETSYKNYIISDSFQEGGYYSLSARNGYRILALNFSVTNPTDADIPVDLIAKAPKYTFSYNGGKTCTNLANFATYTLDSFKGSLPAGKTLDMVILFEIPETETIDEESMGLSVDVDGASYQIEL